MSDVTNVTDGDFGKIVGESKIPVLVDFWAEWCGPCRVAAPVLDELAQEYTGKVMILKLNVDENQAKPAEFGVMSIPTVIGFKDGKEVSRTIGFGGKEGYEQLIKELL